MAEASRTEQAAQPVTIEGRNMLILYGSETGNSQEIAVELADMAQRLHFQTVVDDMDGFKLVGWISYCHHMQPSEADDGIVVHWDLLLILITDRPVAVFFGCVCYIDNRPRRHAQQYIKVLEEPEAREA
jgi:sulfite reductase alpha subunit-like flavoprotein